ncbi:MFS transporter [Aetokthonos hydrillicola Thurmond2011]|jgi:predicted MFS family arabinose efflux permease|uniref:MFS transporter n=1 Tax=Aetokthonos hydrillicola Thurmond2011 TaxID=2712845 RepID=A0AAP5IFG5_9CYAN|nr:MFS transporter [Aetokthonos hydrillicola]MBO3459539.1 MFS transporter [Aetokthonos hydrillicola CCALA 1050]MBW4590288.1 MFS transporter [Aetokthonos hydrillicola CCALA 1050]MDR9899424.1 MFS transporter [Aetokthonos hydrillicola Thurmond2011]
MKVFILIWFGQLVSSIGSSLTDFALGIWVYQRTGSINQFTLITVSSVLPLIVMSPLAGVLVDRWNRRWVMILSDSASALGTIVIALLIATNRIEIWHIYLATAMSSTFYTLQWPAYSAATAQLVPLQHLSRANSMMLLAGSATELISPILGVALLGIIHIQGIILLDFATFLVALFTLFLVKFPDVVAVQIKRTQQVIRNSLLQEVACGWTYIAARKELLGLLIFMVTNNFFVNIFNVLLVPFVLSVTSTNTLGIIISISGIGSLVSSLLISAWGGSQKLIYSLFGFQLLEGLCILLMGLYTRIPLLALCIFLVSFGWPIICGYNQVIWQRKVPPDLQGRTFAVRSMIAGLFRLLAYLVSGPLVEKIFQPLMISNSPIATSIGKIIGTGSHAGMSLVFIIVGFCAVLLTIAAYQYRPLRLMEDELPDVLPS